MSHLSLMSAILLLYGTGVVSNQDQNPQEKRKYPDFVIIEAEQYVLDCFQNGGVAKLDQKCTSAEKRVLRVDFLRDVLTCQQSTEMPCPVLKVRGALFLKPIVLDSIEVTIGVHLNACTFKKPVNLREGHFQKRLFFAGSHFQEMVNLYGLRADEELSFANAKFWGPLVLARARIGGQLNARNAEFLCDENRLRDLKKSDLSSYRGVDVASIVNFNAIRVENDCLMQECVFATSFNCGNALFGRNLNLKAAQFRNSEVNVSFAVMSVQNLLRIEELYCASTTDFRLITVGGSLRGDKVRFTKPEVAATPEDAAATPEDVTVYFDDARISGGFEVQTLQLSGKLHMKRIRTPFLILKAFTQTGLKQQPSDPAVGELVLEDASVDGNLTLEGYHVGSLDVSGLHAEGRGLFTNPSLTTRLRQFLARN